MMRKGTTKNLETDFKRMDLILKTFPKIGAPERIWFINRLLSEHKKLSDIEMKLIKKKVNR